MSCMPTMPCTAVESCPGRLYQHKNGQTIINMKTFLGQHKNQYTESIWVFNTTQKNINMANIDYINTNHENQYQHKNHPKY